MISWMIIALSNKYQIVLVKKKVREGPNIFGTFRITEQSSQQFSKVGLEAKNKSTA